MDIFLYCIIFCMGTLFGSFFTLAVYRIPLHKDITHERSFCPNCHHLLSFLDLIPILSYVFLGGKCRYCKQKIRPRYLCLEILSGLVFVLFAMSIKFSIFSISVSKIVYLLIGYFYFATLFIIAGIDKENKKIENSVLLFGYVTQILYIIYLYIVEKEPNMYRYVIYLSIICILILMNTLLLRKKTKENETIQILLLSMLMVLYTDGFVFGYTVILTLFTIGFYLLIHKLANFKSHKELGSFKIPIAFYLCICNIICLLATNFIAFYSVS